MATLKLPSQFPAGRPPMASLGDIPSAAPHLDQAWTFSQGELDKIRSALASAELPPLIETIAVVGSLGRMEASLHSDCDLIVVLRDSVPFDSPLARHTYDSVWEALSPLSLSRPRADGIYALPTTRLRLLDTATLGKVDEDLATFGSRFQFLLETQPVYEPHAFELLTRDIIQRYASQYVDLAPHKEWTYLLNDLIRYFRSLCITYQWEALGHHGKWRSRNLKARHSRLIMYAGLLLLLGESSREQHDKITWLADRLKLTPLERIAYVYAVHGDAGFARIAANYDRFIAAFADASVRADLAMDDLTGDLPAREANSHYARLKASGDELLAELLRFLLDRRGTWSSRFFEYLIF